MTIYSYLFIKDKHCRLKIFYDKLLYRFKNLNVIIKLMVETFTRIVAGSLGSYIAEEFIVFWICWAHFEGNTKQYFWQSELT